jgi:hypothetical protein
MMSAQIKKYFVAIVVLTVEWPGPLDEELVDVAEAVPIRWDVV